ncbi:MarR family transcriptional regulator [Nocardia sp. NPDC004604]|uniref:MarR family winged helix-turn-helix transcriptional regulator n=1 Tax=Nocardia sp. NPDC004604 TaxID=3157013 RepID=UPI0033BDF1EF
MTLPLFDHVVCLIGKLDFHLQDRFTELLAPLGLHPRQFGMLSLLIDRDGLAQHQLAEPLDVHRTVMVGLVDDLEQRGLVERRRHPVDRRAHAVHLLPAGRELYAQAEAVLNKFEAELLGGLAPDEAKVFGELLQRVSTAAGLRDITHPDLQTTTSTKEL